MSDMTPISQDDPRYAAANKVLDAMQEYFDLDPFTAVKWIEDSRGRLVVFTRGEYKDQIKRVIHDNLQPDRLFECREIGGGNDIQGANLRSSHQ